MYISIIILQLEHLARQVVPAQPDLQGRQVKQAL